MICRIQGVLESIVGSLARLSPPGALTYELLLPAYAASRLGGSIGQPVTLHTVYYLEGSSQGGNLVPRLAGFLDEADREFYSLFTSVKGIGPRKALRAMALSTPQIAAAVAERDLKTLQSLPEIGRRMAETIVASLHGKVDRFIGYPDQGPSRAGATGDRVASAIASGARSASREALEVLVQLGENRIVAAQWIDQVLAAPQHPTDATGIVQEVLRLKAMG